jgi:hypothetical protein
MSATIEIQKKSWRGCTVIIKQSIRPTIHSKFFLVFNGKVHFAPKGAAETKEEAVVWANHKCLSLWKVMQN